MTYKARSLFNLIGDINKELFLPHIQRPFVWDRDQMARLFDSIMRNYPIQTMLFWRTRDEIKAREFMNPVKWDPVLSEYYNEEKSAKDVTKVFVLDGQQRLQTLYAIFSGSIQPEKEPQGKDAPLLEAWFDAASGAAPDDDGILHPLRFEASSPGPSWYRIRDLMGRHQQCNAEVIADELNDALDAQSGEDAPSQRARQRRVRRNIAQLESILRHDRHFWIEELDGVSSGEYDYSRVVDIFVRVNSGGTKLDAADLMFAAMKEGWDEIEENVEGIAAILNEQSLSFDEAFVLRCLVVAHGRGAELGAEKFSGPAGMELLAVIQKDWNRAENAFQQLRDFIGNDLRLYSNKVVRSYGAFVPLFDFLFHNPKPNERARQLMKAYYYKAQLFNWFRARTDNILNVLHGIVGKSLGGSFPIDEIKAWFTTSSAVELSSQHLLDTRLRFILLNIVYVEQFGTSPFNVLFKGNEPHVDHIYPQSKLRKDFQLGAPDINHLGNYRYVGATDNIRKRAELPESYFAGLAAAKIDIRKHLLLEDVSKDPKLLKWDLQTYTDFRDRRLEAIGEIVGRVVNAEQAQETAAAA